MRGKHASHVAAVQVRESALAEAAELRRRNEQQLAKITSLTTELLNERAAHKAKTLRLNGLLKASTNPEVEALRSELKEAQRHAAEADHDAGMRLNKIFTNNPNVKGSPKFWADIAKALNISVSELLDDSTNNRHSRRVNHSKLLGYGDIVSGTEYLKELKEERAELLTEERT